MNKMMEWFSALASSLFAALSSADPGTQLREEASYRLPLAEVSGLAQRPLPGGGMEILAVGDEDFALARLDPAHPDAARLIPLPGTRAGGSQWEAIDADGAGNLFILGEADNRILVLDPELSALGPGLDLEISALEELGAQWAAEPNSQGEGLLLLSQGHLLVLKEKKPALLVEFGPEGAAPRGYGPQTWLQPGEAFALPPHGRLRVLRTWRLSKSLRAIAADGSELALGGDRRLYMLSQESGTLIRLPESLTPAVSEVGFDDYWRLPEGMDKAEGLLVDAQRQPWVALDRKGKDKPNLFRLSRL